MKAYGRIAQNKAVEVDAAEVRIRAERRLCEILAATKAEGRLKQATRRGVNLGHPSNPLARTGSRLNGQVTSDWQSLAGLRGCSEPSSDATCVWGACQSVAAHASGVLSCRR